MGVGSMLADFTGSVSATLAGYMSSIVTVAVAGALMGSTLTGVGVGSAVASFFFSPTQTHSLLSLFCSQFHEASLAWLTEATKDGKKTKNKRRSIGGIKISGVTERKWNRMLMQYFTSIHPSIITKLIQI
jgi:hypothetical protein